MSTKAKKAPREAGGDVEVPSMLFKFGTGKNDVAAPDNIKLSNILIKEGHNPRTVFDKDAVAELAASMKSEGLSRPLLVRPNGKDGKFWLVAGERRLRAAKSLEWDTIPVIVRTDLDDDADAVFAALRDDSELGVPLTPIERAQRFAALAGKSKLSIDVISRRSGFSTRTVRRDLALADAPDDVQEAVSKLNISSGAAGELAKIEDKKVRAEALKSLGEDVTELGIRKFVKARAVEQTRDVQGPSTTRKSNRETGNQRAANLKIPRSRGEITEACTALAVLLWKNKDNPDFKGSEAAFGLTGAVYSLLWASGEFKKEHVLPPLGERDEEIEPTQADRDKRQAAFWKKVESISVISTREETAKQEKEERAKARKEGKGKKKGKKGKKAGEEAPEQPEDADEEDDSDADEGGD